MGRAKAVPPQATDLVPHAAGVQYGQLCSVRRWHLGALRTGTLLACNGAWNRKAVVAYVKYIGSYVDTHGWTQHEYTVGVQRLGHFYADGRACPKPAAVQEVQITTSTGTASYHDLGRWCPVQPAPPAKHKLELQLAKAADANGTPGNYGLHGYPLQGDNGGPTPEQAQQLNAAKKAEVYKSHSSAKPQLAPEAVLDQFIID